MRLVDNGYNESNVVAFDRTATNTYRHIEADWDFAFSGNKAADGGAFALFNTTVYGTTGPGVTTYVGWQDPNLPQSFAVGFDIYPGIHEVSLHWDNAEKASVSTYDYRTGWHDAHLEIDYVAAEPTLRSI